jgi:hypothetical protein
MDANDGHLVWNVGPHSPRVADPLEGPSRNRASTVRLTDIVVEHGAVPVQVRNQPLKECPAFAVAVRVMLVPWVNCALQPVVPAIPLVTVQLIPAGEDLTVPSPVPLPRMVTVLVTSDACPSTSVMLVLSWQA